MEELKKLIDKTEPKESIKILLEEIHKNIFKIAKLEISQDICKITTKYLIKILPLNESKEFVKEIELLTKKQKNE